MKKTIKGFLLGLIIATLLMSTAVGEKLLKTIDVIYNSVNIKVDGKQVDTDNILHKGTTYVPLRAISEMLGKEVDWNGNTKTVNIGNLDDNENYEKYINDRFGFSIDYPTSFQSDYTPANNDGIELSDDEAKIIVFGSHFAYTKDGNIIATDIDSIKGVFDAEISDLKDEKYPISYEKLDEKNNWFVVSYVEEEYIIYKKTILGKDFFAELSIKYPKNLQEKYKSIVERVAYSFNVSNAK